MSRPRWRSGRRSGSRRTSPRELRSCSGASAFAGPAAQPGLVGVISDFRDQHRWERPLGSLQLRHSVLAVEIIDPRETELPRLGYLSLADPETGQRIEIDTSRRRVRERFAELERERRAGVAQELRRLRVGQVSLSTDDDWLVARGRELRGGSSPRWGSR